MPDALGLDARSSEELIEAHRIERQDEDSNWESLSELQRRGGRHEFDLAAALIGSANPEDRAIGAEILGQLGWDAPVFVDESADLLIGLLDDSDSDVLNAAAVALGNRREERAVPALVALAAHPSPEVRFGVVMGLQTQEDPLAIDTLIRLSSDSDYDVRNWATFGLGSQVDADTPEVREALLARLDEEDGEIRGEALVGLARRHAPETRAALLKEWGGEMIGVLSLEAAEELGDPELLPRLQELARHFAGSDDAYFVGQIEDAIAACRRAGSI